MPKNKSHYVCSECGNKSPKWLGRCPECRAWNSFVEEREKTLAPEEFSAAETLALSEVSFHENARHFTGIAEFDRVLGGMLPGQVVLLSGQPGIGKSTLLLEVAAGLSQHGKVYYINGEESAAQVKSRALRLGLSDANIHLLSDNRLESIAARLRADPPFALVLDSIQTAFSERFESYPGSVVQVREVSCGLVSIAKELGILTFVVSHITKGGDIAGPKLLEHVVDTVLFMESDPRFLYRVLRSFKNRFHSCDEAGFFQITDQGLTNLADLSQLFPLMHEDAAHGVTCFPHLEGSRVLMVEAQALVSRMQFSYPRRTAEGMDNNRLLMLLAVMEKHMHLTLSGLDVFVNVTGGLDIADTALDLALAAVVYSSACEKALPQDMVFLGELGLAGELRPVSGMERRLREMQRFGSAKAVIPFASLETAQKSMMQSIVQSSTHDTEQNQAPSDAPHHAPLTLLPAKNLTEILNLLAAAS